MDAQVVSDAFGLGRAHWLSEPLARGELGEVRRVETEQGSWAVKQDLEPGNQAASETSAAYHRQCWEAGLPTPMPIPAASGRFVAEVAGQHLRAYTWVELEDPDTGLDPAAVGGLLASLHGVRRVPRGAVHEWSEAPIGADEWNRVLKASRAAGAPYVDRLVELLPAIVEVESILTPMSGQGDDDRRRTVYDAYRAAGGPGRVTGHDSCAMTVAQLHHIGHRHLRMWLHARNDIARQRSLAGVEEFLNGPLLLPEVDQIVADLT